MKISKICKSYKKRLYRRTKIGLIANIYSGQCGSSKKRGHTAPTYTRKELQDWLFSQKKFHILYDNWKCLDYQKDFIPSVDRKDDSIGYMMTNIQLMTWAENRDKAYKDQRSGKLINMRNNQKQVLQCSLDGEIVAEYVSVNGASRDTGVHVGLISYCCNGKSKTAGGFKWKFK